MLFRFVAELTTIILLRALRRIVIQNLTSHQMASCSGDYIVWIADAFGECISTASEKAGFSLGLISTIVWMYAQLPQIILNFKLKSADGLSFAFILFLCFGDIANLTGVIINHGLLTQVITAIWYIIVDFLCLVQCIWYGNCRKKEYDPVINESYKLPAIPLLLAQAAAVSNPYEPPQLYGTLLGWVSAACYIYSRMPQIIKNCKRRHTEGLSMQYFWSAVLGNVTYALSIFLKDYHWDYIWSQFPWLMGSAGILFFDGTVLVQYFCFRNKNKEFDVSDSSKVMNPIDYVEN